jgi:hypothetical protein
MCSVGLPLGDLGASDAAVLLPLLYSPVHQPATKATRFCLFQARAEAEGKEGKRSKQYAPKRNKHGLCRGENLM